MTASPVLVEASYRALSINMFFQPGVMRANTVGLKKGISGYLKLVATAAVAIAGQLHADAKPFYDFDLIAKEGSRPLNGERVFGLRREVSINESGRVVFIARYFRGSGVITRGIDAGLESLSFGDDELEATDYQFPIINSDGKVVARRIREDRTQVRLFDAENPTTEVDVVYAPPPPNLVSLPALANDGTLGFIRLFEKEEGGTTVEETTLTDITASKLDKVDDAAGLLRPVAADGRIFVVRQGASDDGAVVRYAHTGGGSFSKKEIAKTSANNWIVLGDAPGVSGNGKLTTFVGSRKTLGEAGQPITETGIFLSVSIAGAPGNVSPIPACTENTIVAYDNNAAPITMSSFSTGSRIGVVHYEDGPIGIEGDRAVLVFLAKPTKASRENPGIPGKPLLFTDQTGIWTVRVDFDKELKGNKVIPHISPPLPVVQIGDTLFGAQILDLALHDPIAKAEFEDEEFPLFSEGEEDHYLAFWADTTRGEHVVRARRNRLRYRRPPRPLGNQGYRHGR